MCFAPPPGAINRGPSINRGPTAPIRCLFLRFCLHPFAGYVAIGVTSHDKDGQYKKYVGYQSNRTGFSSNIDVVIMCMPQRVGKNSDKVMGVSLCIVAYANTEKRVVEEHAQPGDPVGQALGGGEGLIGGFCKRDINKSEPGEDRIEKVDGYEADQISSGAHQRCQAQQAYKYAQSGDAHGHYE